MASIIVQNARGWEYREMLVVSGASPQQHEAPPDHWYEQIEGLLDAIERLDDPAWDGWRLVSITLREDGMGGCYLATRLKRPFAEDPAPIGVREAFDVRLADPTMPRVLPFRASVGRAA